MSSSKQNTKRSETVNRQTLPKKKLDFYNKQEGKIRKTCVEVEVKEFDQEIKVLKKKMKQKEIKKEEKKELKKEKIEKKVEKLEEI